jgi:hypothetical protein
MKNDISWTVGPTGLIFGTGNAYGPSMTKMG